MRWFPMVTSKNWARNWPQIGHFFLLILTKNGKDLLRNDLQPQLFWYMYFMSSKPPQEISLSSYNVCTRSFESFIKADFSFQSIITIIWWAVVDYKLRYFIKGLFNNVKYKSRYTCQNLIYTRPKNVYFETKDVRYKSQM